MARNRLLPVLRRAAVACVPTADTVQGPAYRKNAPFRRRLCPPDEPGFPLTVVGTVTGAASCEPLPGALLDVWQTNARGMYSNLLGLERPERPGSYELRGRLHADREGRYRVESVLPGHYPLWIFTRPRHVHFRVSHPGHQTLVTQLYFAGDPYLDRDPWVKESLIVTPERHPDPAHGGLQALFDISLEEAAPGRASMP